MALTFDQTFYLNANQDVLTAVLNGVFSSAEEHFNLVGFKELRDPSASFDTSYYLTQNPDVLAAGINPFTHFVSIGAGEQRAPTAALASAGAGGFDEATYLAANADVQTAIDAGAFKNGYEHWILNGQFEGRAAQTDGGVALTGASTTSTEGSTFALTTGLDSLTGTDNDDTFVGSNTPATVSAADSLDGGAGTDLLQLFGTTTLPQVTNIEKFYLNAPGGDFSIASIAGATELEVDSENLAAARTYTLAAGQVLVLDSVTDTGNTGNDLEVAAASSVTSQSITLDGVGNTSTANQEVDIDINGTGVAALTLTGANNASNVDIVNTGGALTTLNIAGDQKITITQEALPTTVTTVNASSSTGGTDLLIGNANVKITGGSGADRFEFAAANFTSDDTVDGGSGTDTIALADTTVTTAGAAALITALKATTNVETLELVGSGDVALSVNAANVSTINSFTFSGNGTAIDQGTEGTDAAGNEVAITVAGIQDGDSVTIGVDVTGEAGGADANNSGGNTGAAAVVLTPNLDGGSDSVTINLTGGVDIAGGAGAAPGGSGNVAGTAGGNAITATSFETVTISSTGTTANSLTGGAAGAPSGSGAAASAGAGIAVNTNGTINVTGSADMNLGTIVGTNATVNASSFTGKLTVVSEGGNNTITGGSGNDTISLNGGTDTITLGGGNDSLIWLDTTNDTTNDAGTAIISDFTSGSDTLTFDVSGLGTLNGGASNPVSAANYFEGAITSATAATAYSVMIISDQGYATFDAFETALSAQMTDTGDALVGFFNTTEGRFELYVDSNLSTDNDIASADLLGAFTNVTAVSGVAAAFANSDFIFTA